MFISPLEWGVHGWKFLHHIAWGYPNPPTETDKMNYKQFFTIIGSLLPCYSCQEGYKESLIKYPITDEVLLDSMSFMKWTIDIHNEVNRKNNKKIYEYDEAIKLIENNYLETNSQEVTETNSQES